MGRFLPLVFLTVFCACTSTDSRHTESNNYKAVRDGFARPGGTARPKVYWWCLNGNIDTLKAREEFIAMRDAGIGGFDMFEIGTRSRGIPAGPAFLGDESLEIIKFVINEAGKLGLEVGLNVASSWNAGGAWVRPEHGGKSLYRSVVVMQGNSSVQKVNIPFPQIKFPESAIIGGTGKPMIPLRPDGKPQYYEEIAVLALRTGSAGLTGDSEILDISSFFDPKNDELSWEVLPGEWEIHRYVCSNSGQQLVLPSPHSAGLAIDHFDSSAVSTHFNYVIGRLGTVFGDFRKTALKSLYLASYEARGFVWSSQLPSWFRQLNGYDIIKYLPVFFDNSLFEENTRERLQRDFRKTLSEMMINNLYKNARNICNRHGLRINCEAGGPGYPLYNGPAEPLKALGALDIPRGEFWVNHPRYYMDPNGTDSIDLMQVVKEVAAASHIYERGIVEEEAFTSFEHWMEGPADLRPLGDRAFCEGMNRVVFHGFTHNPEGTGYPGIVYHAGTHMNNKRVWWPKIKPFIDYITRLSYISQQADFFSDVLFYYGDKIPNAATQKNTHFKAGPGYDYEVINTEVLLDRLSMKNGELRLSNGAAFRMLALENEPEINPDVLRKLEKLLQQGAVITGEKPERTAEVRNDPLSGESGIELINKLWTEVSDPQGFRPVKGKVHAGVRPVEMLSALIVDPDLDYRDRETWLIDYIHYQSGTTDFYIVRNTSASWISRDCGFRQKNKTAEIWNPLNGEIIPVTVCRREGEHIRVPVTLPPFGSFIVVFREGRMKPPYTGVTVHGEEKDPPELEFTGNGILMMNKLPCELSGPKGSLKVEKSYEPETVDGPWLVHFDRKRGAPESVTFDELISWTAHSDPGIRYYSGTGRYRKTFSCDELNSVSGDDRIFLDLGEISEVAEVWLNGEPLGISWTKPFRYDVTEVIREGENDLEVEVANTWCNRITGDALRGEKYTSTNITHVGLHTWDKVPLNPSGLMGPVTLQHVRLVR